MTYHCFCPNCGASNKQQGFNYSWQFCYCGWKTNGYLEPPYTYDKNTNSDLEPPYTYNINTNTIPYLACDSKSKEKRLTEVICSDCKGKGEIIVQSAADGADLIIADCPFCEGDGYVFEYNTEKSKTSKITTIDIEEMFEWVIQDAKAAVTEAVKECELLQLDNEQDNQKFLKNVEEKLRGKFNVE